MNTDKFSNYLLALLLTLQLIGYLIFFSLWIRFGTPGAILAIVLVFIIDSLSLYYIQRIKVTNDKGIKQTLSDIISDVIGVVIWLGVSSILFTIITMVIGYKLAIDNNLPKEIGLFIPFLAVGTLYGSLFFVSKVCKN